MALKFDLNLQKLASVVVAINFWELPDIKTRRLDQQQAWDKIIEEVIRYVQLIIGPKKIQREIVSLIPFIGEKILDFTKFVIQHGLPFNTGNSENIPFTSVGTTNDMKIFELFCEKNVDLKLNGVYRFEHESSCKFQNLITSSEKIGTYFPVRFGRSYQMFFIYLKEVSPIILHCKKYKMQKRLQMIIHLLNEMSDKQEVKRTICTYFNEFSEMCLTIWPYQELIFQMLDVIAEVENIDFYYEKLYRLVLYNIEKSHHFRNFLKKNIYLEVLKKLLEVMPVEKKRECVMKNHKTLFWFFKNYDFEPLALIVSDKDLIEQKSKLIDVGIRIFDVFIKDCNFEQVNNFLDAGILSEEEKKAYKNKYTPLLKEFVKREEFDKADKFLDWMSGSGEERIQIKKKIDSFGICQEYYEKNNFDLSVIDSILNRQFDSVQEEIKQIKIA